MAVKEKIDIFPWKWQIESSFSSDQSQELWAWSKLLWYDKLGNNMNALVRIAGYPSSIYVELPDFYNGDIYEWNDIMVSQFSAWLSEELKSPPLNVELCHHSKMYYYDDDFKPPFLRLDFKNKGDLAAAKRLFSEPVSPIDKMTYEFNVHEYDFSDWLKFIASKTLDPCQWLTIPLRMVTGVDKLTKDDIYEFYVKFDEVMACAVDHGVPSFRFKGWDIETMSRNKKAFPEGSFVGDCIMSEAFITYDIPGTTKTIPPLYSYDGRKIDMSSNVIDEKKEEKKEKKEEAVVSRILVAIGERLPIEGVKIVAVKNELELLEKSWEAMDEDDPDFYVGHNMVGFDCVYKHKRWHGIHFKRTLPHLGRLNKILGPGSPCKWVRVRNKDKKKMNGMYFDPMGRACFDTRAYSMREFATKFVAHTLDALAKAFIGIGKKDVDMYETFCRFEEYEANGFEMKNMSKEFMEKVKKDDEYNLWDAELCPKIVKKLNIPIALREYANIFKVQPHELFMKGPNFRFVSAAFYDAKQEKYICDKVEREYKPYNGALVQKRKPVMIDLSIFYDFTQMYPSIIIDKNICFTTFVPEGLRGGDGIPASKCNIYKYKETVPDVKDAAEFKKSKGKKNIPMKEVEVEHWFVKKEIRMGLLPKMMIRYKEKRAAAKKLLKDAKERGDGFMTTIYNFRQEALKLGANAGYGSLGLQFKGGMSLVEGASLVTAGGREVWMETLNIILKELQRIVDMGGKIEIDSIKKGPDGKPEKIVIEIKPDFQDGFLLYGDTDSIVGNQKQPTYTHTMSLGIHLMNVINKFYKGRMGIEIEKVARALFLAPKMYILQFYKGDNLFERNKTTGRYERVLKGIAGARKGEADWIVSSQADSIDVLFELKSYKEVFATIAQDIQKLLEGKVKIDDLVKTVKMGHSYEKPCMLSVFGTRLQEAGTPAQPGDALDYIVTRTAEQKKGGLGNRVFTISAYREMLKAGTAPPLDIEYYVESLLKKVNKLWVAAFGFQEVMQVDIGGKVHKFKDPATILLKMIKAVHPTQYTDFVCQIFDVTFGAKQEKVRLGVVAEHKQATHPASSMGLSL